MVSINSYSGEAVDREQDGAIEIHSIIQAMGVVAVADKRIRQEEVDMIVMLICPTLEILKNKTQKD